MTPCFGWKCVLDLGEPRYIHLKCLITRKSCSYYRGVTTLQHMAQIVRSMYKVKSVSLHLSSRVFHLSKKLYGFCKF